jgi:hypothetical protein
MAKFALVIVIVIALAIITGVLDPVITELQQFGQTLASLG